MSELGVAFKCIAAYAKDRPFMKLYDMQRYADFQIYSSLASSVGPQKEEECRKTLIVCMFRVYVV